MPDRRVVLVDTSVLSRMVGLDGDAHRQEINEDFDRRRKRGDSFVIPVTSVIETGNHVAQAKASVREAAALRLIRVIEAAKTEKPPWIIRETVWDESFVSRLLEGDSTGSELRELLRNGRMGTGDVAILVERDLFKAKTAYSEVDVWTLDAELGAHGSS